MSHSGDRALVALTAEGRVGVDLEVVRDVPDAPRIAERFFSNEECAALDALGREAWRGAFFLCWTRKEAFIKALGAGLSHPLDAFAVTVSPYAPARLLRADGVDGGPSAWSLRDLSGLPAYAAAVAAEHPDIDVNRRPWRWNADGNDV
jgi:4'-phosphopantetheinyl transferase